MIWPVVAVLEDQGWRFELLSPFFSSVCLPGAGWAVVHLGRELLLQAMDLQLSNMP